MKLHLNAFNQFLLHQVNQLGGNYALAVLLTVVCNVVGIFTVPPLLSWLLASKTEVSLDIVGMLVKMLLTLLLPLLVSFCFEIFLLCAVLIVTYNSSSFNGYILSLHVLIHSSFLSHRKLEMNLRRKLESIFEWCYS